jgi:hypothetical protein
MRKTRLIENELAQLEGQFAQATREVIDAAEKGLKLASEQKSAMSHFIAVQFLRTQAQRQIIQQTEEGIVKARLDWFVQAEKTLELSPEDYKVEMNQDHLTLRHLSYVLDAELVNDIIKALVDHIWILGVNATALPLYTSDHPVVKLAHKG